MLQAYSVPAFVFAFVSFLGGCLFAVCNYKYLYVSKLQFFLYKLAPDGFIGKKRNPFCELEVRFLVELLSKKKLTVNELNSLLKINNKSFQNQRQRRHIFLKEINLKLGLIYGENETIIRKESLEDKRVKVYCFMDGLDLTEIENAVP